MLDALVAQLLERRAPMDLFGQPGLGRSAASG
jgi:hypothetical protein